MIQRHDILSIPFLKKSPFTGSLLGMRYRMERQTKEEEPEALLVHVWEGPYCFDATPEEKRRSREFSFDEEGADITTSRIPVGGFDVPDETARALWV